MLILYLQRYIVSFIDCHLYCAAVDDSLKFGQFCQ
jgi:hypothetical protein